MHISKIKLINYKSFNNLEITCNKNFNIIVGENNIGKSSIFEALNLWKTAYDSLISTRNRKKFYAATTACYLGFSELNQLRLIDDDDLFFDEKEKIASIAITINEGDSNFLLEIKFEKPGIKNSYIRIYRNGDFDLFADFIARKNETSLQDAIFIYQTRPISTIFKDEPFYNNGQIEAKIRVGKSHDVLRNKILKTEKSDAPVHERFANLEARILSVLNTKYSLRFKNKNRIDDEYVRITAKAEAESNSRQLEVSLMGSGFLQVLEIFSTLEYMKKITSGICLILIDEPDSHIHANIQSSLIEELRNSAINTQIFIISHNDRLLSKIRDGELLYLTKKSKKEGFLVHCPLEEYKIIQQDLASNLEEFLGTTHLPIIITEGRTDKKILETAWSKLFPEEKLIFTIIPSGLNHLDEEKRTGGAKQLNNTLSYLSTVYNYITIGLFDNDKEGVEQLKGLNKELFEDFNLEKNIVRKHKRKPIYGMSLPVPETRKLFVTDNDIIQRYFTIECYFSNETLDEHNLKGTSILGTEVFNLKDNNKVDFSEKCTDLKKEDFIHFEILFEKLREIISQQT